MSEKEQWSTEFPTEPGHYLFYGFRYGRVSCGYKCKPELMFMTVWNISGGLMYVADGQSIEKYEVEDAHFLKAMLPELPEIEGVEKT
ncbi:MAG: hypothetical protein WC455_09105 [Dehalococcoidia bacterium]